MIRGAVLLGVGFGAGYVVCLSHNDEVRDAAVAFKQFLQDVALAEEVARKEAADAAAAKAGAVHPESIADPEPIVEAEVVSPDEDPNEGETP